MSANDTPVMLTRDGAIAHIVLNRPALLNAVNVPMAEALRDACSKIAADSDVRVVVLSGAGKAFMAGGDLARFQAEPADAHEHADALIRPLNEVVLMLAALRQPVIASLHGAVAGAGVSLALACDLAIAADTVNFNLAYARLGASPDVSASWYLPRIVGLRKAMEIALLVENIDAAEALRLGMINRVVPAASLASETMSLAKRLANGPTAAYGATKRLLRGADACTLAQQLDAERDAFCNCARSNDFAEGIAAFYGKRAARFTGT